MGLKKLDQKRARLLAEGYNKCHDRKTSMLQIPTDEDAKETMQSSSDLPKQSIDNDT